MKHERKPTNPKDVSATGKLDLSLFPATALAYGALALTEGDLKYGGFNYRVSGVSACVYLGALARHKARYESGEWEDPKTKVPHLASMLACCAILIDATECDLLNDDRPPQPENLDMSELIERLEKIVAHMKTIFPNKPERFTRENTKQEGQQ